MNLEDSYYVIIFYSTKQRKRESTLIQDYKGRAVVNAARVLTGQGVNLNPVEAAELEFYRPLYILLPMSVVDPRMARAYRSMQRVPKKR